MMPTMKVLAWIFLAAGLLPAEAPRPGDAMTEEARAPVIDFHLRYLSIHGRRQDTLTYDFDGDGKMDLINTSIDLDKNPPERWCAIHLQRNGDYPEKPDFIWALSDRACALVFGDFLPGGGVEVGFIAEDGVWVYPWGKRGPSETPVKIIHARTFYRSPSMRQIPLWQWQMDFDANGLPDLVLPVAEGYRVYFQTAPGIFGKTAFLEADLAPGSPRAVSAARWAEESEVVAAQFVATTQLPRLEPVDIDGDGLSDLVLVQKDTITCFIQKPAGVFSSARPWRVSFPIGTLREEIKKDSVNLSLIRFVDINQDGLADLVVTKIEGELGLWESIKTRIYIHYGTGRGNFDVQKCIVIDGVSIDPEFIDMNGDGKLDAITSRLRTDLMRQAVDGFILGDVALFYEVWQFDPPKRTFFPDPVYEKRILVRKDDLEKTGAGAVPLVFVRGDFTGDGRPDLVQIRPIKDAKNGKESEILIHRGRVRESPKGPRIDFDGTAYWEIPIERHPKGIHIMDINGDGICDILLYNAGALGVLLSRKK